MYVEPSESFGVEVSNRLRYVVSSIREIKSILRNLGGRLKVRVWNSLVEGQFAGDKLVVVKVEKMFHRIVNESDQTMKEFPDNVLQETGTCSCSLFTITQLLLSRYFCVRL